MLAIKASVTFQFTRQTEKEEDSHPDYIVGTGGKDIGVAWERIRGGVDIMTVKELLRHSDIKTTMRYAHINEEGKTEGSIEGGYVWQTWDRGGSCVTALESDDFR